MSDKLQNDIWENKTVLDFVYNTIYVIRIEEIIVNLEKGDNYNVDYLNNKLQLYMEAAATTLGLDPRAVMAKDEHLLPVTMSDKARNGFENDYSRKYYLKYFTQLLTYFKSKNGNIE